MRVRLAICAVVVLALGASSACGRSREEGKTPSGARASCSADADCVITDHTSCCTMCPDAPRAIPRLSWEQLDNRCRAVDCAAPSDRVQCPRVEPVTDHVARCKDGTCAAVRR